jgi:hypothetical protein
MIHFEQRRMITPLPAFVDALSTSPYTIKSILLVGFPSLAVVSSTSRVYTTRIIVGNQPAISCKGRYRRRLVREECPTRNTHISVITVLAVLLSLFSSQVEPIHSVGYWRTTLGVEETGRLPLQ